jgi:hypothetical protein
VKLLWRAPGVEVHDFPALQGLGVALAALALEGDEAHAQRARAADDVAPGLEMETSMILLLSVTEAYCLDRQHRRVTGATNRRQCRRSAYRAV